ncbi:MAG: succinate dehydrogenase, hydrophobic membrane anchor protein [Pseudomonadota bacterium]|nr:succinate dehydrogenase, hydrophobic membrane anchor protein [Pseudomonadota bacterium]
MSQSESATPQGKVHGLGTAGHGGQHWLAEKTISAALVLLSAWLLASLLWLPALDKQTLTEWLREPTAAVPMALFIVLSFQHALDGMKVVVDDYVHDEGNRFASNTILLFLAVGAGAWALFSLARIAFGVAD